MEVGRSIHAAFPGKSRHPLRALDQRAMELASQDAELRAALFRFVDVTPGLPLARRPRPPPHRLPGGGGRAPAADRGGDAHVGHARPAAPRSGRGRGRACATWRTASSSARRRRPRSRRSATCGSNGAAVSLDLLGEATVTQAEADRYAARCLDALETLAAAAPAWPARPVLEADSLGPLPRVNLSVKVSALTPLLRPEAPEIGREDAARRMRPLLVRAKELGAHLHIDMESVDTIEATLGLVFELLDEPELRAGPSSGIVMQAYLRESPEQLERVIEWASAHRARAAAGGAAREGRLLGPRGGGRAPARLDAAGVRGQARVGPQLRGAHAAPARGLAARAPGDRLAQPALGGPRAWPRRASSGARTATSSSRCCAASATTSPPRSPTSASACGSTARSATWWPGMAYLVRRLLENTVQRVVPGRAAARHADRGAAGGAVSFRNEPILELRRAPARESLLEALRGLDARLPLEVPILVGGDRGAGVRPRLHRPGRARPAGGARRRAPPRRTPPPPSRPPSAASATGARAPAAERAEVLRRAAAILRERRLELAALQVRECAKPWPEADGDVCEAIDFLEYYALEAIELDAGRALVQVPGERNTMRYAPRGVAAVIAPWNFPLAIPCGMTAAALAAGNAAVLKPAEQSPASAGALVDALHEARRAARRAVAAARLRRGRRGAGARPARARDRVHRLERRRARDPARRGRDARGPGPREARGVRDGRQELRDRGRRRRSRRGGPGARRTPPSATRARSARPPRGCSCTRRPPTRCSSAWPAR